MESSKQTVAGSIKSAAEYFAMFIVGYLQGRCVERLSQPNHKHPL